MKRKILELKATREAFLKQMEAAAESGNSESFENAKKEVSACNEQIAQLEAVLAEKSRYAEGGTLNVGEPETEKKKANGFTAFMKHLRREKLSDEEGKLMRKALITGDDAASGENYLLPEDVRTDILEMRKSYVAAKELLTVIPTDCLSGRFTFESGSPAGLTAFDDGDTIPTGDDPTFTSKSWAIKWYGDIIPVSRELLRLAAGLKAYLNRWFVRKSILTENSKIFTALKAGYNSGVPKAVAGWEALKASLAVDLDPSCLIDGVIVTNQSGFACLDAEKDGEGRPVLQSNPAQPTQKLFQGLPVKVFPDAQLANINSTHFPMIYGDLKAAAYFMDFDGLMFDESEHFLFDKNQNALRVIEGFDVINADTSACIYGSFTATA